MEQSNPNPDPTEPLQTALPLRAGRRSEDAPLIPARMLNEFVYCPRLAYLEWVQKEWEDSSDTVEGRHVHRRVDKQSGSLPAPDADFEELQRAQSVELSSKRLDLTAKIDLVESKNGSVTPVDFKRGKRPHVPRRAYDPERVQLCAQGLLLEEHGYECSEGILYFAGSRERVRVPFDEELRTLTRESLHLLRAVVDAGRIPPPLEDSPKCSGCSLVGICLPDEINLLRSASTSVRPLSVAHARSLPVYVQSHRGKVAKQGERLAIFRGRRKTDARAPGRDIATGPYGKHLCHHAHPARVDAQGTFPSPGIRLGDGSWDTRSALDTATWNCVRHSTRRRSTIGYA